MHRVHCHHSMWRMRLQWRELELKSLKDHAQRYLSLKEREVLTDADAWPPAEREKRARVLGRLGDPLGEPVRLELVHVAPPNIRAVMDHEHGQLNNHTGRVYDMMPSISISLYVLLVNAMAGGYNRRTS